MATDSGKTELDYAISLKIVLELREIEISSITGAIIGSVVPPVTSLMAKVIRKVTGQEALIVNVGMNTGLEVVMDNPSSVGDDLIVGAVAGIDRYPVPLILIDMGTDFFYRLIRFAYLLRRLSRRLVSDMLSLFACIRFKMRRSRTNMGMDIEW